MATRFELRQLQRGLNDFNSRYRLGQPHVPVDGEYGQLTDRQSKWCQWVLGLQDVQIGTFALDTIIDWLFHPSNYYAHHPGGYARHRTRLKHLRTPVTTAGLVEFDGVQIAGWIKPLLVAARGKGWTGTIPDKTYGGFRTYEMQAELYREYQAGGGIAASPDLPSNHQLKDFPGGAVDVDDTQGLVDALAKVKGGSELRWAGDSDPVHFSSATHYRETGHF